MPTRYKSVPSRAFSAEDWGVVAGGYVVVFVAALVLIGWWLGVGIFVTALPGFLRMAFNTALCLALLGLSAVLVGMGRARSPVCLGSAVFVIGLGLLVLFEHVSGVELGVSLLFHDLTLGGRAAGDVRMGMNTACALVLLAVVVLLRARRSRAAWRAAHVLSLGVALIALLALAGYVGRYEAAYDWGFNAGMAVHTAGCVLLLATLFAIDTRRLLAGASLFASWLLALCAAAFLLLAVGWVAYRSLDQLAESGRAITRTLNVDASLRQAQLELAELEARRNAFLLAGEPAAGDPLRLRETKVRLSALFAEIAFSTEDEDQRARLRRLRILAVETLAADARLLAAVERAPGTAAELIRSESAVALRAERDAVFRRMLGAEAGMLAERRARSEVAVSEARGVILFGLSFVLLLGAGAVLLLRRILRDLEDSRGRFASIFSSVSEGLVLQDSRGAILECNAAAERVLGLSSAQLAGRDSLDPRWRAVHEDGSPYPGETHPAMVALRTGEPQRDRLMGVHRADGTLVWLSINSEPIRDARGNAVAVVTSFFDITARRAAEQALRESEERWKFAIDGTGDGLWDWDAATNKVFFSRRWKSMLGYAENEIGDDLDEWKSRVHPDDLAPTLAAIADHFEGRTPVYESEHRVRAKHGGYVWIHDRGKVITRAPDGRPLRVIGTHTDLTARRAADQALRESEERFRKTFEHAGIGMAIVGLDGRWLRVNHALLRIVGYDEPGLLALTFQEITHPEDIEADLGQVRRLLAGEISHYQMEKRYLHRDGRVVWIRLTGALVRDVAGAPVNFVAQIEDIDDRKRAAGKLAAYAARLAAKNRELKDFAHVASHDLQEPLRKIQAFGDRLAQLAGARLDTDERDYLARMRAAAARMSGLIQALLAYSRVASQPPAFVPVALGDALRDALQDLELRLEKTGGRVEAGPLPELRGDPVQLRQLFQNLVGNALKYHRPDAPPVVRVSAAPVSSPVAGPCWEIVVEDNGIGFEPRHAEAIFGVFHRLHARGDYEGTGVGLAICRRIVERHGGSIRAEGRPGEGARFIVVLPVAPSSDVLETLEA